MLSNKVASCDGAFRQKQHEAGDTATQTKFNCAASNYDDEELMEGNKLRCKGDFEKIQRMTAFAGSSKETG